MKEIKVEAKVENLAAVNDFVAEQLDEVGCSMSVSMQLEIAIEELFTNICYYAYDEDGGDAVVRTELESDPTAIVITFIDSGKPYDPLAKEDPDITLGVEERPIGGLGIFMVKKTMDDMKYEYLDGQNVLSIKKVLS